MTSEVGAESVKVHLQACGFEMTLEAGSRLGLFQTTLQELWVCGGLVQLLSDAPGACQCPHRLNDVWSSSVLESESWS